MTTKNNSNAGILVQLVLGGYKIETRQSATNEDLIVISKNGLQTCTAVGERFKQDMEKLDESAQIEFLNAKLVAAKLYLDREIDKQQNH